MDIETRVRENIAGYKMFKKGAKVCVAVSGGVDSMTLLHVLSKIKEPLGISIIVCHLDHNLRGRESRRDHDFVKSTAKKLALKFVGKRLKAGELKDVKKDGGMQEAAREARKAFLLDCAKKHNASIVALAHNKNDLIETVLMRLMKGASLGGLKGIAQKSGIFVRPLLDVSRTDIERYARDNKIRFVEDSSNRTEKYLRNKVRLSLVPYMEKNFNPSVVDTIARTARLLSRDDEFIEAAAADIFDAALIKKAKASLTLDIGLLSSVHSALSSRALLRAARAFVRDMEVSAKTMDALLGLLTKGGRAAYVDAGSGVRFSRSYNDMVVAMAPREDDTRAAVGAVELAIPGVTFVKQLKARVHVSILSKAPKTFGADRHTAYFSLDSFDVPLCVRATLPGDRIAPFGMNGRTRKLKDIFIDSKVPLAKRRTTPVIVSATGEVLWLAGLRQAEGHKVAKGTKKVLKLTVEML
ncbi:MAG: tRNA lysidine(34) synthetase TilS [Deltaproteobacteria bacterium]|nr:tRNA lysidine(34) synthetase TilS [Deltaproteobacteria bacterium]